MDKPTMLQRFVSWARNNGYETAFDRGQFADHDTQRAWHIWQAADEAAERAYGVGGTSE